MYWLSSFATQRIAGLDAAVDQDEIADIVIGRTLWPTTFDFEMLRAT
jgi:hypothetical protein